jgi:nucleotide-binding universal stress UspA family protein
MPEITFLKLLVPTAGPAPAKEKAEYIIRLATKLRAEVLALHILATSTDTAKTEQGKEALKIFEDTGLKFNVKVNTYLAEGELLPTILKYAQEKEADLIIMGASDDGKMIAEWIVSDLRYNSDLPVVIEPHGLSSIVDQI